MFLFSIIIRIIELNFVPLQPFLISRVISLPSDINYKTNSGKRLENAFGSETSIINYPLTPNHKTNVIYEYEKPV